MSPPRADVRTPLAWIAAMALAGAALGCTVVLVHYRFPRAVIGPTGITVLGHAAFLLLFAVAVVWARARYPHDLLKARRLVGELVAVAGLLAIGLAWKSLTGLPPGVLAPAMFWTASGFALLLPSIVAINLAVLCGLLLVLEGGLRLLEHARNTDPTWAVGGQYFVADSVLGYRAEAKAGRFPAVDLLRGDTVYRAVYGITSDGWRVVPQPAAPSLRKFAAFFGCSFTFGEGVGDSSTLPASVVQAGYHDARAYDLGFHGWGPQGMLALMESPAIPLGITEPGGVAVFTTIDDHMARLVGAYSVVTRWGSRMPYYTRGPDGSVQRHGDFTSGRPMLSAVFQLVPSSHALETLLERRLTALTPPDWPLMADVLKRSCDLFAARYRSDGCYVLIWPGSLVSHRELVPLLSARGVRVLDYSTLWSPAESGRYAIPMDGHPTPLAYRTVAKRLVADLP